MDQTPHSSESGIEMIVIPPHSIYIWPRAQYQIISYVMWTGASTNAYYSPMSHYAHNKQQWRVKVTNDPWSETSYVSITNLILIPECRV